MSRHAETGLFPDLTGGEGSSPVGSVAPAESTGGTGSGASKAASVTAPEGTAGPGGSGASTSPPFPISTAPGEDLNVTTAASPNGVMQADSARGAMRAADSLGIFMR